MGVNQGNGRTSKSSPSYILKLSKGPEGCNWKITSSMFYRQQELLKSLEFCVSKEWECMICGISKKGLLKI